MMSRRQMIENMNYWSDHRTLSSMATKHSGFNEQGEVDWDFVWSRFEIMAEDAEVEHPTLDDLDGEAYWEAYEANAAVYLLDWLRRTFPSDFHSIPSFESLMASHEELKEAGESLSMPRVVAHTKWAICNVCDGNGVHVNPSIDCGGLTQDDFDQDPEFAESYFSGRYDQTCSGCNGSGKVRIVDTHAKGFIRWVMDQVAEADAASWEYAQEIANERRWGC